MDDTAKMEHKLALMRCVDMETLIKGERLTTLLEKEQRPPTEEENEVLMSFLLVAEYFLKEMEVING